MRKIIVSVAAVFFIVVYACSCARGISPYDAANGKARCGKYIR